MREWTSPFSPLKGGDAATRRFYVLKKGRTPLLYLPCNPQMGETTLRLYPAQTLKARSLVNLLCAFSSVGVRFLFKHLDVPIDANRPFVEFLRSLVPGSQNIPAFGVLEGNVKMIGRRHTILLFNAAGNPVVVVKVGVSQTARKLIRAEQNFFFPHAPSFPALPEAIAVYEDSETSAIAYRYVEGKCPTPKQSGLIPTILNSWIYDVAPIPLGQLPIWAEINLMCRESPDLNPILQSMEKHLVRPVLFHGDFAPWNIRALSNKADPECMVLDWERSAWRGIPGWDWIHYVFEYHAMVRRDSPQAIVTEIEKLWKTPAFLSYAQKTGIDTVLKEITFLYLLYFLRVHSPRDHASRLRGILKKFRSRYFNNIVLKVPKLKVSVITPSYKQLPWLKLCIASIADQEDVAVEHIIQDAQTGSDLEDWVRTHSNAQLHVECDTGMYDAINRGIARSSGDIICWLNSDEQYLEGSLAKVVHYFETHPEIDVLFGDALLLNNKGDLLSYRSTVANQLQYVQASHLNALSCSTFVRRSVFDRGYILDTRWRAISNVVWMAELLHAGIPSAVLHEPLAAFTVTDRNLGRSSLSFTELKMWHAQLSAGKIWSHTYFWLLPRVLELLDKASWSKDVSADVYTISCSEKRVRRSTKDRGTGKPHLS